MLLTLCASETWPQHSRALACDPELQHAIARVLLQPACQQWLRRCKQKHQQGCRSVAMP